MAAGGPHKDRLQAAIHDLLLGEAASHDTGTVSVSRALARLGQFQALKDEVAAAETLLREILGQGLFEIGDYTAQGLRPWNLPIGEAASRACAQWLREGTIFWEHQVFQLEGTPKGLDLGRRLLKKQEARIAGVVNEVRRRLEEGEVARDIVVGLILAYPGESDTQDDQHIFSLSMQELLQTPEIEIGTARGLGFRPWPRGTIGEGLGGQLQESMQTVGTWRNRASDSGAREDGSLGGESFSLRLRKRA